MKNVVFVPSCARIQLVYKSEEGKQEKGRDWSQQKWDFFQSGVGAPGGGEQTIITPIVVKE